MHGRCSDYSSSFRRCSILGKKGGGIDDVPFLRILLLRNRTLFYIDFSLQTTLSDTLVFGIKGKEKDPLMDLGGGGIGDWKRAPGWER